MRYQLPATLDVTVYLGDIFGSKHLATRALLQAARPAVIARCGTYDTALPRLQTPPILVWHPDTEAALQSCYTGGTKALSALKDDILTTLNIQSPVNLQRCPYCLLNDPRTWDHYLPKESYPEYSVYHANLLYVCFGCNHRKGRHYDERELPYCHPYFTVPEGDALLHCNVRVANGVLTIQYYGAGAGALVDKGSIVHRHIVGRLDLAKRFQAEAASLVSNLIGELRHHFPQGINSDPLRSILERRYADAQNQLGCNAWDARLWHGLAACADFLPYANTQITAGGVPSSLGFDVPAPPVP
jgi:hypothetical protein